jgi:glycosyltransferase involved in cell wall biosynthesis
LNSRPTISVCLASYNGERYIEEQLRSILSQLSPGDEVIVVDDASTDKTCEIVSSFRDPRIVLIRGHENQGVLRTFETALSRSTGEIVFLSDQDDVWLPDKVKTILAVFSRNSDLVLVASDALLIDENGGQIGDSYYETRGKFRAGLWANILICKFLGCTMAFRSKLLQNALPFPRSKQVHHDIWLACVSSLMGETTEFIAEPLVAYRRHDANVTGRIRFSTYKRIQMRWQLLLALSAFRMRHRGGKAR